MYGCIGNIGSMGKYGKCKGIKNLERGGCLCLDDPQLHFSSLLYFPLPSLTLSPHISPIHIRHTSSSIYLPSHFTYTHHPHLTSTHIPFFSYTYASHTYPSPSLMLFRYNSKVYFTSPIPVKHIPLLTTGSSKNSL